MMKPTRKMLRTSNLEGGLSQSDRLVDMDQLLNVDSQVAKEIKNLRKARGLTLDTLSDAAGLSKGYLSQIERGVSRPSVKALYHISRALGVTISWFFPPRTEDDDELRDYVVRAEARRKLTFVSGETNELLSPNLGRQLELVYCTLPPNSNSGEETYTHEGEEAGVVISGELHLWFGERHAILSKGDSFAFPSDLPHRYANVSDHECVVIWASTPPSY